MYYVLKVQMAHSKLRLFNMMRTPMGNRAQIECIVDVEIFNSLLHAWAKQASTYMYTCGVRWCFRAIDLPDVALIVLIFDLIP